MKNNLPKLNFKEYNERYKDNKIIKWGDKYTIIILIVIYIILLFI